MNILRQTPFPLEVSYSDLTPNTDYALEIYDDHTELQLSVTVTSDGSGVISYELPTVFEKYDETYSLYIYNLDVNDEPEETVVIDNLYIYRPYVNPLTLADLDCDEEEYTNLERTARQIIDTLVGGFYYTRGEIEASGLGADYLPLSKRANKINAVYENNVKVYDRIDPIDGQYTYVLSPDKTAMTIQVNGEYNRLQSKQVRLPLAASDSFMFYGDDYDAVQALTEIKGAAMFPKDWDYIVYGEWGWPVVPQDIKDATRMLINDMKCGKLSYVQKYVTEYETDQFRVKYSDLSLKGTGNLLVDKILENYSVPIYRLGVL
jgi:hypothetical protein